MSISVLLIMTNLLQRYISKICIKIKYIHFKTKSKFLSFWPVVL